MKILIVSNMYPNKKHSSAGTFVKNFCDQLDTLEIKYDLSVMTKKIGVKAKVIGYFLFYLTTFIKCLLGKYSLVYIHYPSYSSVPVLLARKIRIFNIYVNVHGSDVIPLKPNHKKMQKYTKRALNTAQRIIVPSDYFKSLIIDKYLLDRDKIFVYPSGGVNIKKFTQLGESAVSSLKNQYGLPLNVPIIGFVSRITIDKGWDVFLKASQKIRKDGYNCTFLMVGSGDDDTKVLQMIQEIHLEDYVVRLPAQPQDKLIDLFNMCDIFTFPTVAAESLGLVAIEAMACGCPVIASDYAAPGRYIIDGFNGKKFPKGDDFMLAKCLAEYLDSSNDRKHLLQTGALNTAAKFSTENVKSILKKIMCE